MMQRILSVFLVSSLILSCQKGPEDPFFSLSTRKSRMAGTWEVKSFNSRSPFMVRSFDGSTMEYTIADTLSLSRSYTMQFEFDRDGNFIVTHTEEFLADSLTDSPAYTLETIESGIWEFSGGNDSPAKSKLVLLTEELKSTRSDHSSNVSVITYENPRKGLVYDIVGLSNEELKISFEEVKAFAGGQTLNSEEIKMKKN